MDVHGEALRRLRENGQRYTPGGRAIVEALSGSGGPLTGTRGLGGVPPSSAYRNVLVLVEAGVLHRVSGVDDHARFELAEPFGPHVVMVGPPADGRAW